MRTLALAYGIACYALTGVASLYFVSFVCGLEVPIFAERPGAPTIGALVADLALIVLFGLQHSGMARQWFKRRWTRLIPPPIERSTYVLASNVVLAALVACWQPLGPPASLTILPAPLRWMLWVMAGLGGLIVVAASFQIDHAELLGLRQVWDHYRGRAGGETPFQVRGMYRYVRHPLMTGILILMWAPPVGSLDRLLLAAGMTAYIVLALRWEEHDLQARFGSDYAGYQRRLPRLIPWGGRLSMVAIAMTADGCILPVRAQPGARKAGVKGEQNGALKLAVTAPPEDGRANEALVELLREQLNLKRSQVELISGHTSRDKKFLIRGVGQAELVQRVMKLIAG